MGVHPEVHKESVGFLKTVAAPRARRRWSEAAKGRQVVPALEGAAFPLPAVPVAAEASGAQSQAPVTGLVELVLALRACA